MALPEIRCEFVLQGASFDPQEITDALGLEPTETWRVGDPIAFGKGARRSQAWIMTVGPDRAYKLAPLAIRLMERLAPASQGIREICKQLELEPEIYAPAYIYDESPDLKIPSEVVRWVAEVGASVAVDVLNLREGDDGPSEPTDDRGFPSPGWREGWVRNASVQESI